MTISTEIYYDTKQKTFVGIYDFSYAPYALGDAITWQMNLCVGAIESGVESIVQYIVADPSRPSFHLQRYITANNYVDYLNNLLPVFLCSPSTSSIHLVRNKDAFDLFLVTRVWRSQPTWPGVMDHLLGKWIFSSHRVINKFFHKYNYIPRLTAPRGYENSMNSYLERKCQNRFVVSVNMRQRGWYPNVEEVLRHSGEEISASVLTGQPSGASSRAGGTD